MFHSDVEIMARLNEAITRLTRVQRELAQLSGWLNSLLTEKGDNEHVESATRS